MIISVETQQGAVVSGTLKPNGSIDIGEHCTHCGRDVSWGSGLYVNRIPSGTDDAEYKYELDGYMCAKCQTMICEECGQETLDYSMKPEGGVICDYCSE